MTELEKFYNIIINNGIINEISENFQNIIKKTQAEEFFYLNAIKSKNNNKKKRNAVNFKKIIVGQLFKNIELDNYDTTILPQNFWKFDQISKSEFLNICSDSFIILQNNDFSGIDNAALLNFSELISRIDNSISIIWDTDNHHWIHMSTLLATLFDYYAPAHFENLNIISKFNSNIIGPITSGSLQWKKSLLKENKLNIINKNRKINLIGMHGFYPNFTLRNKIIKTMNVSHEFINFTDGNYKNKSSLENLNEWIDAQINFVANVNNDLPYRIFDGLITASIVLIPNSLRIWANLLDSDNQIIYYSPNDILDSKELIYKANLKYKNFKCILSEEIMENIIEKNHFSNRIKNIINIITKHE